MKGIEIIGVIVVTIAVVAYAVVLGGMALYCREQQKELEEKK